MVRSASSRIYMTQDIVRIGIDFKSSFNWCWMIYYEEWNVLYVGLRLLGNFSSCPLYTQNSWRWSPLWLGNNCATVLQCLSKQSNDEVSDVKDKRMRWRNWSPVKVTLCKQHCEKSIKTKTLIMNVLWWIAK